MTERSEPSIGRFGTMLEVVITVALLVVANWYWQTIGLWVSFEQPTVYVPVISAEFPTLLPQLNTAWQGILFLAIFKLVLGRWSPLLRLVDAIVTAVVAYLLFHLTIGPDLVALRPDVVIADPDSRAAVSQWLPRLALALRIIFGLSFVATVGSSLRKFASLVAPTQTPQLADVGQ